MATEWIATAFAALLAVPAMVFFVECLLSVWPFRASTIERPEGSRAVVLMPAHDEAASILETLERLSAQLGAQDSVLVVADNCTDDTAAIARTAGANVIERTHAADRGKGFALAFGIDHLAAAPPDVVIIMDADCRLSSGAVDDLVASALREDRPIQAEYVFEPPNRSPLTMVSALAALIRNKVRPRGLLRLGMPCHLMGSGMAFPWRVLRKAPPTGAYLVEDLLMGVELALAGHPARHSVDAGVRSVLPTKTDAAMSQRRRWEHGQLVTLARHGPRLLGAGLVRANPGLIALALDLMVPPLTFFVFVLLAAAGGSVALQTVTATTMPLAIIGGALAMVLVGVLVGWIRFGTRLVPLRYLLAAPFYLLWKVPLYLSFMLGRRQKEWQRTER